MAPQVGSLPDPMAGLTAFLLTPETRTGPQNAMVSLSQRFPWFGKLDLRSQRALAAAAAAGASAEAKALELVTETRRLAYELAFLDRWRDIVRADRVDPRPLRGAGRVPLHRRRRPRPGGDQDPGGDHQGRVPPAPDRRPPGHRSSPSSTPCATGRPGWRSSRRRCPKPRQVRRVDGHARAPGARRPAGDRTGRRGDLRRREEHRAGRPRTLPGRHRRLHLHPGRQARRRARPDQPAPGQRRRHPRPHRLGQPAGLAGPDRGRPRGGAGPEARRRELARGRWPPASTAPWAS